MLFVWRIVAGKVSNEGALAACIGGGPPRVAVSVLRRSASTGDDAMPSVLISGWTRSVTAPGRQFRVSVGSIRSVPSMVSGRIGRLRSIASRKAPFLKATTWPGLTRVPSGKNKMHMPLINLLAASWIAYLLGSGPIKTMDSQEA